MVGLRALGTLRPLVKLRYFWRTFFISNAWVVYTILLKIPCVSLYDIISHLSFLIWKQTYRGNWFSLVEFLKAGYTRLMALALRTFPSPCVSLLHCPTRSGISSHSNGFTQILVSGPLLSLNSLLGPDTQQVSRKPLNQYLWQLKYIEKDMHGSLGFHSFLFWFWLIF